MDRTLGVVTIGQAPRPDVTRELAALLPPCRIVEHGALDGLSAGAVAAMAPEPGEDALTSRLADGSAVVFSHRRVEPLVAAAVERCEDDGADVVLLACGEEFHGPAGRRPLVRAGAVAHASVRGLATGTTVGVVRPLASQCEAAGRAWRAALSADVVTTAADPFDGGPDDLARAVGSIAGACGLVVLDCFGFDESHRAAAAAVTSVPVLLIRSLAARLAGELLAAAPAGLPR